MKKIICLLAVSGLLLSFSPAGGIDQVINAMKSGNAAIISQYFDNTVDLKLPSANSSFGKRQAEVVLRDFFSTYIVRDFVISFKNDKAGRPYCTGTLITNNGNFRTSIQMKQRGDVQLLQEIEFKSDR